MAIVFELDEGDAVLIGAVRVSIRQKRGRKIRLSIEAPDGVPVERLKQPPTAAEIVAGKGVASIKS